MTYISFITTIKICKGYESFVSKIHTYIQNIQHFCNVNNISYEILICQDIDDKNIELINISYENTKVINLQQKYPNPFNFNMIESYGKNECLKIAKGVYTCMTSADQIFSEKFFLFVKNSLEMETFYRFATYETAFFEVNKKSVTEIVDLCKGDKTKRLCNPGCFSPPLNFVKLGQKSGDIMLLDTKSFQKIRGWPETECFAHMDTVVCMVASNVMKVCVPPPDICTYTMVQDRNESNVSPRKLPNWAAIIMEKHIPNIEQHTIENYQWLRALQYKNKRTCN